MPRLRHEAAIHDYEDYYIIDGRIPSEISTGRRATRVDRQFSVSVSLGGRARAFEGFVAARSIPNGELQQGRGFGMGE